MTKIVLIGGFLGAGKTTLISELARRYQAAGKRVGIITNDQADDLVDTNNLRAQGFNVGEVAGACFCCSFDNLVETADRLVGDNQPDILLAEPVGSCTDLVATVVLPLQNLLGERFELAAFGVLLKPSHGRRILAGDDASSASGFSAQAEYIFTKQLEEADYVMIGRRDQLSDDEVAALTAKINEAAPGVPVVAVSPLRGDGVDEVIGYIESSMTAGRRLLEIDYDTYAIGEADLGWVNLAATWTPDVNGGATDIDLNAMVQRLVAAIANKASEHGEIAHLKASASTGQARAVANVVASGHDVDLGLVALTQGRGPVDLIVNARVSMDPETLLAISQTALQSTCHSLGGAVAITSSVSLRPGRPTPTHRVTAGTS